MCLVALRQDLEEYEAEKEEIVEALRHATHKKAHELEKRHLECLKNIRLTWQDIRMVQRLENA